MSYVSRQISARIEALKDKFPVIALTGPRQSGKTTLLKKLFPGYTYLSLEDENILAFAENDVRGFLEKYNGKIIFDEVQRAPGIFSQLQVVVDQKGTMGEFVLSGSQNFHLMERITQSLAGRVAIFKLLPFDSSEIITDDNTLSWQEQAIKGFYPAIYDRQLDPLFFYPNYLQTYIDRDVSDLTNIHDLGRFRTFIALCAGRIGQILNLNSLANECGISQPTAKSWLSVLERSYIVFLLRPFHENFNKRATKRPKLYFYDTGLASFLLEIRSPEDLDEPTLKGALFENLVIADIIKQNHHRYTQKNYYFWRERNGLEVDLLTRKGLQFEVSEIKATQTIRKRLLTNMDAFDEATGNRVRQKTLIYSGEENQDWTDYRIRNWKDVLN